jgi:repressor LexA
MGRGNDTRVEVVMPEALTKIERRILDYVVDYLRKNTYQPSIREIGKRFGIKSTKTVSEHLQALAEKGYVERDASRSRGLRLLGVNLAPNVVSVPHFGEVAAGEPEELRKTASDRFELDRRLVGSESAFLLEADGDSMSGIGILDGDLVLVEPVDLGEVADGAIVAARLDGKATIKRLYSNGGDLVLEPAHADFAPMLVREHDDFALLGRVVGLFRRIENAQPAPAAG